MGLGQKPEGNGDREAFLATRRFPEAIKHKHPHWPLYAALSGALVAHVPARDLMAMAHTAPLMRAARPSRAKHVSRPLFEGGAALAVQQAQAQAKAPAINAGGVVPIYGSTSQIQPGEWISIFGANLAGGTAEWTGNFPTMLGGTQVEINGKPAYLSYVSPTQINAQAPDDSALGPVSVKVITAGGTAVSAVTLMPYSPSFNLLDAVHVAAIILRPNGGGMYGGGAYDILGPTGDCFGYGSVAAQPGEVVSIFGVGFGPTNPAVPSGKPFAGAAPITDPITLFINGVQLTPTFVGLSGPGLYQMNVAIPPGIGQGDVPIQALIGGLSTQKNALFSLGGGSAVMTSCVVTGDGEVGDGGDGDGGTIGDGGDGGDGDGGTIGDG